MNYLAHFHLSSLYAGHGDMNESDVIVGGFLGDFVKGRLNPKPETARDSGIVLHRRIDSFTDNHHLQHQARACFREQRRFAGIVLDILFDHYLAKHWHRYSEQPLPEYIEHVHMVMAAAEHGFPDRARKISMLMRQQHWLQSYQSHGGIIDVLRRLSTRMPVAVQLHHCREVHSHYDFFETLFFGFYRELIQYVSELRGDYQKLYGIDSP